MISKKGLHKTVVLLGLLIAGLLIYATVSGISPVEVSLFWGLLAILIGIPLAGLSLLWLGLLVFRRDMETSVILRGFRYLLTSGLSLFLTGLFLLSGVYLHQILLGRMEGRWIFFWPAILLASIVFWIGLYRKIISSNLQTLETWKPFLRREDAESKALLKYLLKEVILQGQLREESRIRWIRHILIYWGFILLWMTDLSFAFVNDFLPVFGWSQFMQPDNPLRLILDLLLDAFGLMILAGISIALIRACFVKGTDQKVYNDTLTVGFLLVVVLSGYLLEGIRLASMPHQPYMNYSFFGSFIASGLRDLNLPFPSLHHMLWYFHVILSCTFIAYVPLRRLIHSCATPVGKLMQSQRFMLERKLRAVARGLLQAEE